MNLYVDAEFNGHAGQLISLAIAAPDGRHFYEVLPLPERIDPWVAANVVPVLGRDAVPHDTFRALFWRYMISRPNCTFIGDWPDDFTHLMRLMAGPSYMSRLICDCRMHLLERSNPKPEVPHNALSDAIALMRWHSEQGETC